jgi:hypothetical protein
VSGEDVAEGVEENLHLARVIGDVGEIRRRANE